MNPALLDDALETAQFSVDDTLHQHAPTAPAEWSYEEAFSRNLGLINAEEQQKLRRSRIAIAGMGGVGGVHLITLARLGVGKFTIADPDTFEVANFNRQYGARLDTVGRSKVEVMVEDVRRINPEVEIDVLPGGITLDAVPAFLDGADLFVDGMDLFQMDLRRRLFAQAANNGIYGTTAAPMGFSVAWMNFAPQGPSFDRYFDLNDQMTELQKVASLAVGLAPSATHRGYLDLSHVNLEAQHGPSTGAACQLAAGVIAAQAVRILLDRGRPIAAPRCFQFDAYRGVLSRRTLRWGNRQPVQRLKRWGLLRFAAKMSGR